jgi:MFS transporter, DHA3 family, macrolide efflux protein
MSSTTIDAGAAPAPAGMRTFFALALSYLLAYLGSGMTRFALGVWVFERTGDAVAYTILLLLAVLPIGLGSLVAGPLVDRWNRRRVLIGAYGVASLSMLTVALLFFAGQLQLWQIYLALFVNGIANAFVLPAFDASVPLLVPKAQLARAAGISQLVPALDTLLSPSLAAFLFGLIGLGGIFAIELVAIVASIGILLALRIPQPTGSEGAEARGNLWREFRFGVGYIVARPAFLFLMAFVTLLMFLVPGFGYALATPMLLSFTTPQVLGFTLSGFGFGSLVAGIVMSAWGGPRRRTSGMLAGALVAGLAMIAVGARESPPVIAAGFFLLGVAFITMVILNRVIWQSKAAPEVLGRIFSLRVALGVGAQSLGILLAGPLATRVFEPLMAEGGALAGSVGLLLGVGPGRGMALMYVLVGLLVIGLALVAFLTPAIRQLEDRVPDYQPAREAHAG